MGSVNEIPTHLPPGVTPESIQSHLSPRSRSLSNFPQDVKRAKPNRITSEHSLTQLESPKKEVHEVIEDILNNRPLKNGYQYYYSKVESICKFKHSEQSLLSEYLKDRIESSFYTTTKPNIETISNSDLMAAEFITRFLQIYQDWENKLLLLRKIFLYIDRNYLLQHPTKKVILELGLGLFIDNILTDSTELSTIIINKYLHILQQFIQQDSESELIPITKILIKLNFDNSIKLNEKLISSICKDYEAFKNEWFKNPDSYIHLCLLKVSKIITFFKNCGQSNEFLQKLLIKLRWIMIFQDFNDIIQNCLPYILKQPQQIKTIYGFCNNTMRDYSLDSSKILVFQWGKLILDEVVKTINGFDDNKSNNLIITLNSSSIYYNSIIEQFFENDNKFSLEARNSFGKALNSNKKINNQIISQLCKFIDSNIKNFNKKSSLNFNEFLEVFLTIFKYLNNKNDFVVIFKRELSRRLLLNKNTNIDSEKLLVEKIMEIIGETDDSVGLNIMFKDLELSKLKYHKLDFIKEFEFSTLVLDKKHWPEIPKQQNDINLNYFKPFLDKFDEYYKNSDEKLKNHKLNWDNYSLHQLTIIGRFKSGEYELLVNLYQAIIINLFDEQDQWEFNNLVQETKFDIKFLKRVINSLSDKYKILIEQDQIITFNENFTDKSKKLKIPMLRDKDSNVIEDKVIQRNRNNEIRSHLIKIMKIETKLPMMELINKLLVNNKRGPISIQDIKQNIEYLITNEFLTRDNDGTTLIYIP
ncbi:cullin-3 [[Candida] jaroonii]|uniref:Cullin-3 n=1 Tax=[Candida] jaroonii TaxID=467808 RepID=A0ACA9Y294_9ASCO|nr:cullin-3 [[Candida] jaroonii]